MYKSMIAILTFLSMLLTCATTLQSRPSDDGEIYFKDVNVLIIGRCRTIFSEITPIVLLSVGKRAEFGIDVTDKPMEELYIFVKDGTKADFSLGPTNDSVHISNLNGVIFYGTFKQISWGKIPHIIFVYCHAEQVWIREPGWEPGS
jgi:hypothetical protein